MKDKIRTILNNLKDDEELRRKIVSDLREYLDLKSLANILEDEGDNSSIWVDGNVKLYLEHDFIVMYLKDKAGHIDRTPIVSIADPDYKDKVLDVVDRELYPNLTPRSFTNT